MSTIRIASPEGTVAHDVRALAPVPAELRGKRLAVLDNGKPNAALLLTSIVRRLRDRSDVVVGPVVGKTSAAHPADADVLANLRLRADVVLTGSGD